MVSLTSKEIGHIRTALKEYENRLREKEDEGTASEVRTLQRLIA